MLSHSNILFGVQQEGRRPRHIEIGIGDRPGFTGGCLSLNHKDTDIPLRSATEFVAYASDKDLQAWRAAVPFGDGEDPFAGLTIAVEDASPDTCVALVCLKERLCGRPFSAAWIAFASEWEQGFTPPGVAVERMAGALINAFTHSFLTSENGKLSVAVEGRGGILAVATEYVSGLMSAGIDPWDVPDLLPVTAGTRAVELHKVARTALARERSHYDRALAGALKVQLSVPIEGARRRMDIDAVFMTEVEFTGVLKVLLRQDDTAPLGRGYPLWGLYRPTMRGTGFDMTISTDPVERIDLKQLWIEIERAEEEAWEAYAATHGPEYRRPREPRRSGILSFDEKPEICKPSCQPWWEGRPLYTMIAAPRSVTVAGETVPASRLEWTQVLQILWRLYSPAQNLLLRRFEAPDELGWHLIDQPPAQARRVLVDTRTELFGVRLCLTPASDGSPFAWSPVIAASFAAFIDVGRVEMDRLPSTEDFDVIEARGGLAMVTTRGMLLLETASRADFPLEELDRSARDVAATLDCARAIVDHINGVVRALVVKAIHTGGAADKRRALKAIYSAKLKAREAWAQTARFEEDPLVRRFRELCEQRWKAEGRLSAALTEIAELETMVVSSSEVRANATLNAIAFFGFPLSICGNLLGGLLIANRQMASDDSVVWPVLGIGVVSPILVIFLLSSATLLAALWIFAKISDSRWRPNQDG